MAKLTKYYIFFNFAPNPIEIKPIPRQTKEIRINYNDFVVKLGSVVTKKVRETKDSIKLAIWFVKDGSNFLFYS